MFKNICFPCRQNSSSFLKFVVFFKNKSKYICMHLLESTLTFYLEHHTTGIITNTASFVFIAIHADSFCLQIIV